MIEEVTVEDGKYSFQYDTETYKLICLRNGQPWREFIGDKAVFALFVQALYATEKVKILEKESKAKFTMPAWPY